MLAALLLTIFVGFLTAVDDDFAVLLLVPFFCFVFGVLNVFYGVFLADKRAQKKAAALKAHAVPMMPVQQGFPAELPAAGSRPLKVSRSEGQLPRWFSRPA